MPACNGTGDIVMSNQERIESYKRVIEELS